MDISLQHVLKEIRSLRRDIKKLTTPLKLLSRSDVARVLQVSLRTVDRRLARGELPPGRMIGTQRRWTLEEITAA